MEKSLYSYSNNELLDMYNDDNRRNGEVVGEIVRRFKDDCCLMGGENEDEQFARQFSKFVNGKMRKARNVAESMSDKHRYLQGEMFKVCMEYIRVLSECYETGRYDARNKYACKTSSAIVDSLIGK